LIRLGLKFDPGTVPSSGSFIHKEWRETNMSCLPVIIEAEPRSLSTADAIRKDAIEHAREEIRAGKPMAEVKDGLEFVLRHAQESADWIEAELERRGIIL
jgi:hypothetical protein